MGKSWHSIMVFEDKVKYCCLRLLETVRVQLRLRLVRLLRMWFFSMEWIGITVRCTQLFLFFNTTESQLQQFNWMELKNPFTQYYCDCNSDFVFAANVLSRIQWNCLHGAIATILSTSIQPTRSKNKSHSQIAVCGMGLLALVWGRDFGGTSVVAVGACELYFEPVFYAYFARTFRRWRELP